MKNKPVTVITGACQVGKTTPCGLIQKELGFGYVSLANVLERQAGEEYKGKDIDGFRLLSGSRYELGKGAIVCTTDRVYPVGEKAYALPVSAI